MRNALSLQLFHNCCLLFWLTVYIHHLIVYHTTFVDYSRCFPRNDSRILVHNIKYRGQLTAHVLSTLPSS